MTTAVNLANVATGPAFSAYRATTPQSITTSTWTKVQLNAENFDTANCFDSTTNYRFTPNVAGYYQINAQIYCNYTSSAGIRIGLSIYKNGSGYAESTLTSNSSSIYGVADNSTLVYLNGTTDYVELYGYIIATGPEFYFLSVNTQMSGFLARAA
jgi:hypothetical protein